jgi:hypothetical protein
MDLSLSLRTSCADVSSEIACEHDASTAVPETLAVHVEADTPNYLIVDGFIPNTIPSMYLWMGLDPTRARAVPGAAAPVARAARAARAAQAAQADDLPTAESAASAVGRVVPRDAVVVQAPNKRSPSRRTRRDGLIAGC